MNEKRYIGKLFISIGLILIFISSSTRYIPEFKYLTDYLFLIGGLFIVIYGVVSLIHKDIEINRSFKNVTLIYGIFISFVMISTFVNHNLETEIDALVKFTLIYFFLNLFLTLTEITTKRLVIITFVISSLIIFTYFLINYPIAEATGAYKGGFGNPNSVGVLAVTLFSVSLVAGTNLLKNKRSTILAIIYLIIAIAAGYLTLISNSRTSFITLVIVFVIVTITFIYDVLKRRQLLSWKSIIYVSLLALFGVSMFILIENPAYTVLETTVIDKFQRKIENGSLTAGRVEIWQPIIEGAGLFGKGSSYFSEISGLGAHNSFLHILSLYGWLAAIAYAIFWLVMLIKSLIYYITHKTTHIHALLPLVLMINYISVSMMENMTVHVSAFLAMTMVAIFNKTNMLNLKETY